MCFLSETPEIQIDGNSSEFTVLLGDPVCMGVRVCGYPQPDVRWTSGRRDVKRIKDVQLETDGNKHRLKIAKADVQHEGKYRITAFNDEGVDTKEIQLTIE